MANFGRPRALTRENTLGVWANGRRMGAWSMYAGGEHWFQYDDAWRASPDAWPLSLSLPFTPGNAPHRGERVLNFFDNLLPENDTIRRRLRDKFTTGSIDAFPLLAAIGRDCVGAVQLLPHGEQPEGYDRIACVPLDEQGVEQMLNNALAGGRVLGQEQEDDFRISIAGVQEKTALLRQGGRWCRPLGATPTTHIFKLPLGMVGNLQLDMRDSVENEWLCAQLMLLMGLPAAPCEIATFGSRKVLIVERFDRSQQLTPAGQPWIARLAQEDFCQALGLASQMKYESDGGPGMRQILRQLDISSNAAADKLRFVKTQLLFWLMAATDGHAKNFSVHLKPGGRFRLTPSYDVLSAWPIIGPGARQLHFRKARLAMALRGKNAHYHLYQMQAQHWQSLALQTGVAEAFDHLVALVLQVPQVLASAAELLPRDFPARVFESIRAGMTAQAETFMDNLG